LPTGILFYALFVHYQIRQLRVSLDALDFIGDNLLNLVLDEVVVGINLLLHGVVGILVGEIDNLRYLNVAGSLLENINDRYK